MFPRESLRGIAAKRIGVEVGGSAIDLCRLLSRGGKSKRLREVDDPVRTGFFSRFAHCPAPFTRRLADCFERAAPGHREVEGRFELWGELARRSDCLTGIGPLALAHLRASSSMKVSKKT